MDEEKTIWQRGRFRTERILGEGAFGIIFLADDVREKRKVAIKQYKSDRFSEEPELLLQVREIPGVVRALENFQEDGREHLVMEYLDGGSLKEYLKKVRTVSPEKALEILTPVLHTAAALHGRGILHCDISPDNLMFDGQGKLKLIDFGAAVTKGSFREEKELKAGYAPVELYLEKEKAGPWTDIYALCAVWYEMVTGKKVPPAPERLKKDILLPPSAFVKVDPKLEEAFRRGLSLEIQQRYFSVENLAARLSVSGLENPALGAAMRELWGELWIRITTEAERTAASGIAGGRMRRKLKFVLGMAAGLTAAFLLARGGIRWYEDSHPEKVLERRLRREREEADRLERKMVVAADSEEYRDVLAFLEENSYEIDRGYISTYRILPEALEGWEYPGETAGSFPVKAETAKQVLDQFMGEEGRQENRRFNGYINVYTEKDWYPVKVYLNWEETFSYGEDSAGVYSDYVTDLVDYMYLSSGDEDRIREFLREMLPVVSPESRLTDQEIEELIQHVAGGQDYISIELNEKCAVSLSAGYEDQITAIFTAR